MKTPATLLTALALIAMSAFVRADLNASLSASTVNAALGTEVLFTGTLTNTSATDKLYLNGIQMSLIGNSPSYLSFQSTTFYANVPGVLLPGETYTGPLFRATLAAAGLTGDYPGTVTLQGGADIAATNSLASLGFLILSPSVTIAATVPDASEFGPQAGTIHVSRSGSTGISLDVQYAITGNAVAGTDYTAIPASLVTIPAGAAAADISIVPIPNDVVNGDRTIALTLAPSNTAYNLSLATYATVTIHDKPMDIWRLQRFGALANTPTAADSADPDHDGLPNLLEYALTLNPLAYDTSNIPVTTLSAGYLTLSYVPNASATDLTYSIEASTDLLTWSSQNVELATVQNPIPPTRLTYRYKYPVAPGLDVFLRLRVNR